MNEVDLNCDTGEGFGAYTLGDDAEILRLVTSANVACGFHAGDPATMRRTVEIALECGVRIGAHPSLPDLVGFGRRAMKITPQEAYDLILYQTGALDAFIRAAGGRLSHVKPHGALYNVSARDEAIAAAIAEAMRRYNPALILYGLAGSKSLDAARRAGLCTASEVFADRTYRSDGTLTPRSHADALITDHDAALRQVTRMVKEGLVTSVQNTDVPIKADTICIHGDTPGALSLARHLRTALDTAGIAVRPIIS